MGWRAETLARGIAPATATHSLCVSGRRARLRSNVPSGGVASALRHGEQELVREADRGALAVYHGNEAVRPGPGPFRARGVRCSWSEGIRCGLRGWTQETLMSGWRLGRPVLESERAAHLRSSFASQPAMVVFSVHPVAERRFSSSGRSDL